jgi:hypothetical protein
MDELQQVYTLLIPRLQTSEDLEKNADARRLVTKAATDVVTLGLLKSAAMNPALMKGLLYGTGAAIPATAAGSYLIHRAGKESRKTTEDIRNKALQAAAGIAAIGGGMYALHRTQAGKTAAVQKDPEILLEKLATVGFLDVLFEEQRLHDNPSIRYKAAECRLLNAEHGVDLLRQLLT